MLERLSPFFSVLSIAGHGEIGFTPWEEIELNFSIHGKLCFFLQVQNRPSSRSLEKRGLRGWRRGMEVDRSTIAIGSANEAEGTT